MPTGCLLSVLAVELVLEEGKVVRCGNAAGSLWCAQVLLVGVDFSLYRSRPLTTYAAHRTFEGLIASGAFSVFSTPLGCPGGKECEPNAPLACNGRNHSGVSMAAAVVSGEVRDSIPVGPCSRGADLETATGARSTKQVARAARPAPPASHPRSEEEMGPSLGATHNCGGGLDGLIGSPESREFGVVDGFDEETGDDGVDAADWLDVTHAMLGAIDDPAFASP